QCLEHIVLTEEALLEHTKELMAQPANPESSTDITSTDQELIEKIENRSQKFKASENLQPNGINIEISEAFKEFDDQREKIKEYIRQANVEDLRNHVSSSPAGTIDAYQSLLFI